MREQAAHKVAALSATSGTWPDRTARLLDIRPGEGRLVVLLILHSFFLGVPMVLSETVANTLFLVSFGAEALPYVYIGFAVASTLAGLLYDRIERRVSFSQILIINLATIFISLFVLRIGLAFPGQRWIIAALAVWNEVLWVLASLEFGALLGRVFDIRQGKRLFGLASSGDILAAIGGGLLVPVIVRFVGTPNLLVVGCVSIGIAVSLLFAILRSTSDLFDEEDEDNDIDQAQGISLFRNRYVVLILAFSALSLLGSFFLDNIFYEVIEEHYPDAEQLASVLGIFYATTGVLTFICKTAISGRLLTRFGLLAGLLAMPVVVAIGVTTVISSNLILAAGLVFWPIVITKLLNEVLNDAIDDPASLILYQPLTPDQRIRSQTIVESIVEPVAGGAAGVLLLLLINGLGFDTGALMIGLLIIIIIWIISGVMLGGTYQDALRHAIRMHRVSTPELDLSDASTRLVVGQAMASSHGAEVLYALDLLDTSTEQVTSEQLTTLLRHNAPEVRRAALRRIEQQRRTELAGAVSQLMKRENKPEVCEAALRALAAIGDETAIETIAPYLKETDLQLRRGAFVGLLRSGGIPGVLMAGQQLVDLTTSSSTTDRILATQVLEEIGLRNFYQPLIRLLHDREHVVRQSALAAAGAVGHPRLWPHVLPSLSRPGLRGAATAALLQGRDSIRPIIEEYFADTKQHYEIVRSLTRVLKHIPDEWVTTLLAPRLEEPASEWRTDILRALAAQKYRSAPEHIAVITRQIRIEADYAASLRRAHQDWEQQPTHTLLVRALSHELNEIRRRIFMLLSFIFDAEVLQHTQLALSFGDRAQRGYAIEIIDDLITRDLKPYVLPLLDDSASEQHHASGTFEATNDDIRRLATLVEGDPVNYTSWVKICACYSAGLEPRLEYRAVLQAACKAPDALLHDTAAWALSQLDMGARSGEPMLTTLERVIILKTVEIFAATPDVVLAEVASIIHEIDVLANQTIFEKGALGTSMYVIIEGQVRVHDGNRTLNMLGARAVFGEMALLDPEPRSATVTTVEDTRLFVIEHAPFYDVMDDRIEVARGIIRVLANYVRARVRDVSELHARVEELEQAARQHHHD